MVHAVEKAIMAANLGLTPSTEGQVIHLRIPELNEERRKELVKVAHKYAETARVAVRHVRRDGMETLKKLEKDHQISQDDHKRFDDRGAKGDRSIDPRHRRHAHAEGKGDHDGLIRRHHAAAQDRTIAVPDAASRRHHHGWQRPLGGGARAAARRGASARRRGAAQDRARRRRTRHLVSHHLFLQRRKTGRGRRPRSATSWACCAASSATTSPNCIAAASSVRVIGERAISSRKSAGLLEEAEELTTSNDRLTLVVAFNYGARQEIARAAARLAAEVKAGRIEPEADNRRPARQEPRRAGSSRPRSHHPHQRRAAAVEFPALAGRL